MDQQRRAAAVVIRGASGGSGALVARELGTRGADRAPREETAAI